MCARTTWPRMWYQGAREGAELERSESRKTLSAVAGFRARTGAHIGRVLDPEPLDVPGVTGQPLLLLSLMTTRSPPMP